MADANVFVARAVVVEFPAFADSGGRDLAALSVEVSPADAPTLVAGLDDISIILVDPTLDENEAEAEATAPVEVEE